MLTELEAVNRMLSAIPLGSVSSLSSPLDPVASQAVVVLAESRRWFLQMGWEFNREIDVTLSPNASNEIEVPHNYMAVRFTDRPRDLRQVIQRGTRMYDRTNKTYTFTEDIHVDVLVDLPFTEIPAVAQEAIAAEATLRLKRLMAPEDVAVRALASHAAQAFTNAKFEEQRAGKFFASDDPQTYGIISRPNYRRGPYL